MSTHYYWDFCVFVASTTGNMRSSRQTEIVLGLGNEKVGRRTQKTFLRSSVGNSDTGHLRCQRSELG
jgi:hypothetical protein